VSTVVVEQRLRTRGLVGLLGAVAVIVGGVDVVVVASVAHESPVAVVVMSVAFVIVVCSVLGFAVVEVAVIEDGTKRSLVVRYGPGGVLRQTFPPAELEGAVAGDYSLLQMGGWGYRGSLRVLRRAALVTRRGEALDLSLSKGRRFIVTVDHPEDFVRALGFST